ncbi:DUF4395 domain-containing protein [Candidatus Woesearchaeota archaeon]|nr:DUF4395 domain-containing protein [Candidatus Woesearchaeota archaeon]
MKQFGTLVKGYPVRVLNEREARAGAGILFLFAISAFLQAWFLGNFNPTKLFVVLFLVDFSLRLFVNPRYAPSLVLGRLLTRRQKVEYVGAAQKYFAWSIGFVLGFTMFVLVVILNTVGPLNLFVCLACLALLFFETAFGICIGCNIYNMLYKDEAAFCPGGVCEVRDREPIQEVNISQVVVLVVILVGMILLPGLGVLSLDEEPIPDEVVFEEDCEPPQWAIDMGHGDMWKLHHNCE